MNVPCSASRAPQPRLGQRRREDRVPRHAAHDHRGAHQRRGRAATQVGRRRAAGCRRSGPGRCAAAPAGRAARRPGRPGRCRPCGAAARAPARPLALGAASRLGRRRSAGRRGSRSAGHDADGRTLARWRAVAARGMATASLVGRRGPRRRRVGQAKRSARCARAATAMRRARARAPRRGRAASRPAPCASPRGHEHAVDAVAHDVAVAGDVGGDDRRAGGERLGQHHAEALAAQRRRARAGRPRPAPAPSRRRRPCPATLTPRVPSSSSGATSSRSRRRA